MFTQPTIRGQIKIFTYITFERKILLLREYATNWVYVYPVKEKLGDTSVIKTS